MREILNPLGALCVLLVLGLSAPLAALAAKGAAKQAAKQEGPCGEVTAACERAGFARGAGGGAGLQVDCVNPIMQGTSQPKRASKPLPKIAPQVVAACKASNPAFGQGKELPAEPVAQPAPVSAPLPAAAQNAPSPGAAAGGKRPNIVFILTDDLALNLVQYMPHVVKMQKDGVTFANYFVTDSLCCPSRSSIFTGRFPHDTGIFVNTGREGGFQAFHNHHHEQMTFATALATAGYRTAMMGKYLNGYKPQTNPPEPGWSLWEVAG
ncbi:MAG TPA: sulfatase-like hydrolase/transferase, partial [Xanthobacteraceae bacterium]